MPSKIEFLTPTLPKVPFLKDEELVIYLESLTRELNRSFQEIRDLKASYAGVFRIVKTVPGAAFTLNEDGLIIFAKPSANRTSDVTTAIRDGNDGEMLLIVNISTFTLTIKDAANTDLGGADVVLATGDSLLLVWSSDLSTWCKV